MECPKCNRSFEKNSNRQKYCSDCGRREAATCLACGKDFITKGNTSGKFCSRECFHSTVRLPDRQPRPCPQKILNYGSDLSLQGVRASDYHCAGCNCFKE